MNDLFTTGAICGILRTSRFTVWGYVNQFPDFFSKDAKKHTRGRRYTLADLEVLEAIRYLKNQHHGVEKIRALLAKGWRPVKNTSQDTKLAAELLQQVIDLVSQYKSQVATVNRIALVYNALQETLQILDKRTREDRSHFVDFEKRFEKFEKIAKKRFPATFDF